MEIGVKKMGLGSLEEESLPVATGTEESLPVASAFLIQQDWEAYSPDQHAVWAELVRRRMVQLHEHACEEYLEGFQLIGLREDRIPRLSEVNLRLRPRTGGSATPVSGFLPPDAFFEMLAARQFPTTTYIRGRESFDYTPSPTSFTMSLAMCPCMLIRCLRIFCSTTDRVCATLHSKEDLERMGRLFWFTVEFGVIRQQGTIKLYGSGLISSQGESDYVVEWRA